MNRTQLLRWGGGLVAALLVIVFVVVRAGGGSDAEPLPFGEEQPAPVSFSDRPLWDERKLGMSAVAGIELRGGTAIVAGDVPGGESRLAVVDVRTGAPRWVVSSGYPLRGGDGAVARHGIGYHAEFMRDISGKPVVYGDGDDWSVLVQYTKGLQGRETELGVAALSGEDGTVRWRHALVRPRSGDAGEEDRDKKMRLLAADTRVVLTSVESEQGIDPKTVALDPATGKPLWEREDGWLYRIDGDLALGETRGDGTSSALGDLRKNTDVIALDAKTGRPRWNLGERYQSSHLEAATGGAAVVTVSEQPPARSYSEQRTVVIDTATGRATADPMGGKENGEMPETGYLYNCADDGRTLIACSGFEGRLVTIRPGRHGEPVTAGQRPFGEDRTVRVHAVWQDRIFVSGVITREPEEYAVLDRAANRLGPVPDGVAAAVSDRAAAFRVRRAGSSSSTPDGLVVYASAVGGAPSEPAGPGKPTVTPPKIDTAPLWTAGGGEAPAAAPVKDTGLRSMISIDLAGDAVVYTGRERDDDANKLVVADAGTGRARWSIREGASLGGGAEAGFIGGALPIVPHIVDAGGERLALIRYETSGDEEGIAALALKDGDVRWKKRAVAGDGFVSLEAADEKHFAVRVFRYDLPEDDQDETVVYATGSRRELWRKRGVTPESVGGGLVLASERGPAEDGPREPRDLMAYRASDGKQAWRLGKRYREPELLHDAGGETIVVRTADGGVVLDRATGRELARTYAPLVRCDGDGDALIVCEAGSDEGGGPDPGTRALTIQTRGGTTKINDLLETGFLTRYGAIGNWFTAVRPATGTGQGSKPEQFVLLDAAGRQIAGGLPGRPTEIDGGFAVLTPSTVTNEIGGTGVPSFTVHRVRK